MARLGAAAAGTLAIALLAFALLTPQPKSDSQRTVSKAVMPVQPLAFEPNAGRFGPKYDFVARGRGATLGVTAARATLAVGKGQVLRTSLVGADPSAHARGVRKLPGVINWYIGKSRTGLPTYSGVKFGQVYPG